MVSPATWNLDSFPPEPELRLLLLLAEIEHGQIFRPHPREYLVKILFEFSATCQELTT